VVLAVLVNDALDPVVVLAQRLVAPPLLQISVQIILPTFNNKNYLTPMVIKIGQSNF
jgi:hypothetical protein